MNASLLIPEWSVWSVLILLLGAEMLKGSRISNLAEARTFSLASIVGTLLVGIMIFFITRQSNSAFGGIYVADGISRFFKLYFVIALFFVMPMVYAFFLSTRYRMEEFYLILWITLLGMFFLASANDLLILFLSLELVTLSFYVLTSYDKRNLASIEAGVKYLIIGSLASAFMIFGIAILYFVTGTTSLTLLREFMLANPGHPLALFAIVCILSAAGFKTASVPFQMWAPDVYQGAPVPCVAFLAVASKAAGFLVLIRLVFDAFAGLEMQRPILFTVLAAMTLVYGNFGALNQKNIKRLLGYSSIGHAGYLLIGIAAGAKSGVAATLYYLLAYAVSSLALFFVVSLVHNQSGDDELASYRGLAKRSPFLGACLFISAISLAGVPPTAGFFAKFLVLLAAVKSGLGWLALLGAVAVAVSLYYYLNLIRIAYIEEPVSLKTEPTVAHKILLGLLIAGIFILGFAGEPFIAWTNRIASSLF